MCFATFGNVLNQKEKKKRVINREPPSKKKRERERERTTTTKKKKKREHSLHSCEIFFFSSFSSSLAFLFFCYSRFSSFTSWAFCSSAALFAPNQPSSCVIGKTGSITRSHTSLTTSATPR